MDPTRRLWAIGGLAVGLAGLALVLQRPLPLGGAALVGAWILSRQYLFLRAVTRVSDDVSVTQEVGQTWVQSGQTVPVTLSVTLGQPTRLRCTLESGLPTAATAAESLGVTVPTGLASAEKTSTVRWPVAGRHVFDQATLTVTDGLFAQQLPVGPRPTVTVEPAAPRNVHVGEGGDRLQSTYGEHEAGHEGTGVEPSEIREYRPGDTLEQIDWNATARLGTPHVREFETETDRKTVLVVDHRQSLATGRQNQTKLDYLREVALAFTDSARQLGDPLGFLSVGDDGITTSLDPDTTASQYVTVRRTLLTLSPTPASQPTSGPAETARTQELTDSGVADSSLVHQRGSQTMADIRRALATLGGTTPFEETLRPFYADQQQYQTLIDSEPLFNAVRQAITTERGPVFTVICTDDSSPVELRETVQVARRGNGRVLVLLAPSVLYEPDGLADLERAYERYVQFEELRRELAQLPGVTAFEVGPGDRLASVLATGRQTRQRVGGETS